MTTLPPLFLSHGSPMTALEPREAGAFMQRLGPALAAAHGRPRAILAVSAHSLAREPMLLAAARHEAIYDFGGFDPRLHTLRYDAPGAPALAARVVGLLQAAGLPVHTVDDGGLDHGIWTPLRYLFPDADIPVLPLAWPPDWSPAQLFALGQALAPLADEGVLIVGSGSITHNLRRVFASGRMQVDQPATPESTAFRDWFATTAAVADWDALLDYRQQAPHAALMHPTDEHLLPFYVAAGAAGRVPATRIHQSLTFGDLGMDAFAFGPGAQALAV
ncbi:DODA-type extradiol aromatic ring-opening family dioxygenase [Rubrivivax sp. RP6-9]|uniref:DODA-type extradiol aromatic ring-opening family dioxygenase n=1 Tax=Rubrivivax sp. RP6-9 TaxID=3415750 RepID=UPI003CC67314